MTLGEIGASDPESATGLHRCDLSMTGADEALPPLSLIPPILSPKRLRLMAHCASLGLGESEREREGTLFAPHRCLLGTGMMQLMEPRLTCER